MSSILTGDINKLIQHFKSLQDLGVFCYLIANVDSECVILSNLLWTEPIEERLLDRNIYLGRYINSYENGLGLDVLINNVYNTVLLIQCENGDKLSMDDLEYIRKLPVKRMDEEEISKFSVNAFSMIYSIMNDETKIETSITNNEDYGCRHSIRFMGSDTILSNQSEIYVVGDEIPRRMNDDFVKLINNYYLLNCNSSFFKKGFVNIKDQMKNTNNLIERI